MSRRSPKLASMGVTPNSVSVGLMGEAGWLLVLCSTGSCSCERKPALRRGNVSLEFEVNGRLGMWLARCETRASQEPFVCGFCCGSRPYAASKVRLDEASLTSSASAYGTEALRNGGGWLPGGSPLFHVARVAGKVLRGLRALSVVQRGECTPSHCS